MITDVPREETVKRRILFVDDEPSILSALRKTLSGQRYLWEMVFVTSGEEALREIAQSAFDVVVSDMRMPGMDGAELLSRVKELCPTAARIILSGHADRETAARTLPVAHQFLGKPADMAELRNVIDRTCKLNVLLANPAIRAMMSNIDKLPTPPAAYLELCSAINDRSVSVAGLASIVERDPAMSMKILQVCNSAFFGLARRVGSIQQAVVYLGADLLKGMALGVHVFAMGEGPAIEGFSLEAMRRASLEAAGLARRFARDRKVGDAAFTASIVHDVFYMALASAFPDKLAEMVRVARASRRPFHVVERELFGASHAEVSAYLIGVWGLPFELVEAVAYHHEPARAVVGNEVLAIMHAVDAMMRDGHLESRDALLDRNFLEGAGYASEVDKWVAMAAEQRGRKT